MGTVGYVGGLMGRGKREGAVSSISTEIFLFGWFLRIRAHTSTAFSVAGAPFWKLRDASILDKIC